MAKQNLLLVDADQRSLRVLEVSLRKAGYSVTACADALTAIDMIGMSRPDMIISDTRLPEVDGFQLVERLRQNEDSGDIPFMFLSSDGSVESKVKGLELGVQDYLTKPIYIKEIITRVNLELQRRQRVGLERKSMETKTRFSGSLADMGLVDLLQTIDISRKSGVLYLTSPAGQRGAIYFDVGGLKHAELGKLRGEWALYRALVWNEGSFEVEFRPVRLDEVTISMSTQGLLMEGMRRLDEWGRLLEQLPPLEAVFEINEGELRDRLAEIPDQINDVLKYFDGTRSLLDVVDEVAKDDLETLAAISKLYFEGLIVDSGMRTSLLSPAPRAGDTPSESGIDDPEREMDEETAAMAAVGVVPGEAGDVLVSVKEGLSMAESSGQADARATEADIAVAPLANSEPPAPNEAEGERSVEAPLELRELKAVRSVAESLPDNVIRFPQQGGAALAVAEPEAEPETSAPELEEPLPVMDPDEQVVLRTAQTNPPRMSKWRSGEPALASEPGIAAAAAAPVEVDGETPSDARASAAPSLSGLDGDMNEFSDEFFAAESYESTLAAPAVRSPRRVDPVGQPDAQEPAPSTHDVVWRYMGLLTAAAVISFFVYHLATRDSEGRFGDIGQPVHVVTPEIRATPTPAHEAAAANDPAADVEPALVASPEGDPMVDAGAAMLADPLPPAEIEPAAPSSAALEEALATARRTRGRSARAAWEAVLVIQPASTEALDELGWGALNRGQNELARDYARRAVASDNSLSRGWLTLSAALRALDDKAGARVAAQSCLDHGAGQYVGDCRDLLRQLGPR